MPGQKALALAFGRSRRPRTRTSRIITGVSACAWRFKKRISGYLRLGAERLTKRLRWCQLGGICPVLFLP